MNLDSRIKIITQENKGAGASRNIGIDNATGEYVYFMDSDDYLELTAFEKLNSFLLDKSPDFLMFKLNNFYEETGESIDDDYYTMPYLKNRVGENPFSYDDVSDFALNLCVCPPGNLFKREFISDIRFPEGLLFEDNVFFTHALFKAEEIYFYDEFIYNRRRRLDSTTSPISIRSLDTIEITNMIFDLCHEFDHNTHQEELYHRTFHNIYQIFKKADESQKEEFFEKIKEEYLKNKDKWESDDYFKNNLNPNHRHIFKCALKSKDARRFEKCADDYSKESRLNKLRKKLL
jgi:glycosyltransferase involved in cell wall biosynthesis